ncbi:MULTISPECIES: alpha/beta fold hydrolase [Streptomyces]|uniref:Alpha/beta hydrolase n=3 Tax=Streptomyces TaxID=1883 RepID=A0A8A1UUZ2_STRR1|nr:MULTISPECIES: alpha/beta hydrolase [Streptomyces]KOG65962.1 lipase [Streptomyces griseoflavus]KOG72312.1 lipase [Kitasatospora aureofaciens]KEF02894.1 lipase [Streptomyces rimosus]KEF18731.1 lipase [Streptomyces rimosus]KOT29498.1 lipase [Streptomyces rimosus subsp. rimosus]
MSDRTGAAADTAIDAAQAAAGAATAVGGWTRAGRHAGIAGAAIGVVAAGAAAGVAIERLTVGRGMRRKARLALDAAGPYGTLRGTPGTAVAEDGTELHYEIDEPGDGKNTKGGGTGSARRKRLLKLLGRRAEAPTVVFCHGYCLNQDSWHFQRAALRGAVRTVHWDQRSHGRSERGRSQRDGTERVTIDLLGRDLKAVLDTTVPEGPIVLVGHSMGGMTVMALADQYPDFVAERVAGVALIGTSAGRLSEVAFGLPSLGVKAFHKLAPGVLKALGSQSELVEKGRRATADLFAGLVKRYSFGTPKEVDPGVARFAERMIEATPIDVVAEFFPAFAVHDKTEALANFDAVPALVLAGDRDLITPSDHSDTIAELLPGAESVCEPGAGHLVMLERPEVVTGHLETLIERAAAAAAAARSARA